MQTFFMLAIFLLSITSTFSLSYAYDTGYLNTLINETHRLKLSDQHYWNLLLHYRTVRDGRESAVDDPQFFLSKKGRSDPEAEAEIAATLMSFFAAPVEDNDHARCRFVARYTWLKEQLHINESRLPIVTCPDFERTISDINPQSVVLIFPVAYTNSPVSMFGHTFLRIDGANKSTLASTAINYAAITEERMGISYAWKGLSGGLRGYYYTLPYHEKIREYTAIEHRDIWEYRLNLTEEEARRIVLHIWEMRNIHSPYYFFDKNCSFAVLCSTSLRSRVLRCG